MVDRIEGVPYVEAKGFGNVRHATNLIVMHATDNTASPADEAAYAARRTDGTSTHLFVDGDSEVQCVPLSRIAYGCYFHGNAISVQIEMCGLSNQIPERTWWNAAQWAAFFCVLYNIPVRKLTPQEVRSAYYSGQPRGICGHLDVTAAFPEDGGDHTDPGTTFPWDRFLAEVESRMAGLEESNASYQAMIWRQEAVTHMRDAVIGGPLNGEPVELVRVMRSLTGSLTYLQQKVAALDAKVATAASAEDIAAAIIRQLSARAGQ